MSIETFDDFNSSYQIDHSKPNKPFQFREDKTREGTLEWLTQDFDMLEQKSQSRIYSYQRWSQMYKGIHWRRQRTSDNRREEQYNDKKPKMVNNFIYELIDSRVAQVAKFSSNFTCIPWNGEANDINNAEACDKLLRARADNLSLDSLHRKADRIKYKYGDVFMFVEWDKNEGPYLPAYDALRKQFPEGIPPKILKKMKGKTLNIGDVNVRVVAPDRIFPEAYSEEWEKVRYFHEVEWVNIDELKADHPSVKKEIKENQKNYYNYSTHEVSRPKDMVMVRKFYHKPTKHLPEGAFITYTDDVILEWKEYPYEHGKLPFIHDMDMLVERELWSRPAISQIEQMQRHYNNIDSSIARDLGVGSAPKWMVPKGSVDFRSLGNEFTVAEFKGPVAPQLISGNPLSKDALVQQDRMEKRMTRLMKVYDIARGEVPAGVTANSALRFLDEQGSQVLMDDEKKRKRRILDVYKMMMQVMSQYYSKDDGRIVRTLGKDNTYMIESLEEADFREIYDVQFQNAPALPDSKTGKIGAIIDLNMATQTDPIFRREDIVQMLDMGMDESFVDGATVALKAAQMCIQELSRGRRVPEPAMHDDLMIHYTTFFKHIQSYQFKTRVNPEIQANFYQHIETIEGLLFIKGQKNPKLGMELTRLNYFPAFFTLPEMPPQLPTPGAGGGEPPAAGGPAALPLDKMENTNRATKEAQNKEANQ